MRLTGKDVAATLSTGLVLAVYFAFLHRSTLPLITSARGTAGVVFVFGWLGGCALSGAGDLYSAARTLSLGAIVIPTAVGVVALAAVVVALATGSQAALTVLVVATVLLWLSATLRHLRTRSPSPFGGTGSAVAGDRASTCV
jgi:hypothetical protein